MTDLVQIRGYNNETCIKTGNARGCSSGGTFPADAFVTTWKTDNTGSIESGSNQIKLPLDSNGTYDFTVDWGDGSQDTITAYDQAEATHTYNSPGTFDVVIEGEIDGFGFFTFGEDSSKILDVKQWGTVKLHNRGRQFYDCDNLTGFSATDEPDLSAVTNIRRMFRFASSFTGGVDGWDVSSVTDIGSEPFDFDTGTVMNDADLPVWGTCP